MTPGVREFRQRDEGAQGMPISAASATADRLTPERQPHDGEQGGITAEHELKELLRRWAWEFRLAAHLAADGTRHGQFAEMPQLVHTSMPTHGTSDH